MKVGMAIFTPISNFSIDNYLPKVVYVFGEKKIIIYYSFTLNEIQPCYQDTLPQRDMDIQTSCCFYILLNIGKQGSTILPLEARVCLLITLLF